MFKLLELQSEVPSGFFENVDLSLYFKTLTTLKDNCDLNLLISEHRSGNKFASSSSRRSMNSLSDYVRAKETGIGSKTVTYRKSSKIKLSTGGRSRELQ